MSGPRIVYTSGSDSPEIQTLRFDPATGSFTLLHQADVGPGSGYLAFSADGRRVYAINRTPAHVIAFAVEDGGALTRINQVAIPEALGSTHIAVHPGGRLVLVAHFGSGHVSVLPLNADGSVGQASDVQKTEREAHQTVSTADGRFLFVPCRAGNVVCQFVVDAGTGKLRRNDPFMVPAERPGAGPRHLALHPSQRFAFLLNELDGTMTSYRLDPERGHLSEPQTVPSVPAGFHETAAAHIEVHPSGHTVYASNREHSSLALWRFDASRRHLEPLGFETARGRIQSPRDFTVSRDGELLLVASQKGGTLVAYRIGDEGILEEIGSGRHQAAPTFIGILPR
jgi:6-phosphogluconolactonase